MSDDRISRYLVKNNQSLLFDELSDAYLKKAGVYEFLKGVPVPITQDAVEELNALTIALGMARVIGGDQDFRYTNQYMRFIAKVFGEKFVEVLIGEGAKAGSAGEFELAIMYFRAAMLLDPSSRDALYLYARACKDAYELEERDEGYVGSFKAESIESFETLTIDYPDFAFGYYFLGYAYANLGLYLKAKITWDEFLRLSKELIESESSEDESSQINIPVSDIVEMHEEIKERVAMIEEPVIIEQGCNMILAGNYKGGRDLLQEYTTGRYSQWWPLWFHLGVAESSLGNADAAISNYKEALKLTPSNTNIMGELAELYEAIGDDVNANKYRTKIEVVLEGIANEEPLNGLE